MWGLFGKQARLARRFGTTFNEMLEASDPHRRIALSDAALQMIDELEPWPFPQPPRAAIGLALGVAGQARLQLGQRAPDQIEIAVQALERASTYLQERDGEPWAILMMNLAMALAESSRGDRGARMERAIAASEQALRLLTPSQHHESWLTATLNLASYYGSRTFGDALANHERCLELHLAVFASVEGERSLRRSMISAAVGTAYLNRIAGTRPDNVERAIAYIEGGLAEISADAHPFEWAATQMNLSLAYAGLLGPGRPQHMERAILANDECLRAVTRDSAPKLWAQAQVNRAALFAQRPLGTGTENFAEAARACEAALSVFTADRFPVEHATALGQLAQVRMGPGYDTMGPDAERSLEEARRAAAALDRHSMPAAWADAQVVVANTLVESKRGDRRARIEEAILTYEAAIVVLEESNRITDSARVMGQLANAYADRLEGVDLENMEKAIALQEAALKRIDQFAEPLSWGMAMRNLSLSYATRIAGSRTDNIETAIALGELAAVALSERSYPDQRRGLLENLGDAFVVRSRGARRENLQTAVRLFHAALRGVDEFRPERLVLVTEKLRQAERQWRAAGGTQLDVDGEVEPPDTRPFDFEAYIDERRQELGRISRDDSPGPWAHQQIAIGRAYISHSPGGNGEDFLKEWRARYLPRALEHFEAALGAASRTSHPGTWGDAWMRIADVQTLLHMIAELEELGPDGLAARSKTDLVRAPELASSRHLDAAIGAAERALEVHSIERAAGAYCEIASRLGELKMWRRDWKGADAAYALARRAADRLVGIGTTQPGDLTRGLEAVGGMTYRAAFSALMLGEVDRALDLVEHGRARQLANALTFDALPLEPTVRARLDTLRREIRSCEERLASGRLVDRRPPLSRSIRLRGEMTTLMADALAAADESSNGALLDELVQDGFVIAVPILTEVGGRLAIVFSRDGRRRTHVVELQSSVDIFGVFNHRITGQRHGWFDTYSKRRGAALTDESWFDALDGAARDLGQSVAEPLMTALDSLGVPRGSHLHVLPQGPLGVLPLGMARDRASGDALIDRYAVSFSPSLAALRHARRRRDRQATPTSLALVASTGAGTDTALPYAELEIALAQSWYDQSSQVLLTGRQATREAALAAVAGRDLWHVVAHGEFDAHQPLRSALHLAGGEQLTLEALFDRRDLGGPRLVILSSCESGLYDVRERPQEFIGWPTAVLQAGAAGVIATLWPVADISTTLLVGRFYEELLGNRGTPAAALGSAQRWLRGATIRDLQSALRAWAAAGRAPVTAAASFADALEQNAAGDLGDGERPFASPHNWAGFVHYGV